MGMSSLFFFCLIYTRSGAEEAHNSEMPTGTDQKAPVKAYFLQPNDQEKDSLVRHNVKMIIAFLWPTSQKKTVVPFPNHRNKEWGGVKTPPITMLQCLRSQAEKLDLHFFQKGGRPSPQCQLETMGGIQLPTSLCSMEAHLRWCQGDLVENQNFYQC